LSGEARRKGGVRWGLRRWWECRRVGVRWGSGWGSWIEEFLGGSFAEGWDGRRWGVEPGSSVELRRTERGVGCWLEPGEGFRGRFGRVVKLVVGGRRWELRTGRGWLWGSGARG